MYIEDTIAAIATPVGCGGIGIVRVSGSQASAVADKVFRKQGNGGLESHRFYYGRIVDPADNALIDEGMGVLMRAPRSYTREDVLELHCHGGYLVVQRVLDACLQAGARLSEAGEFNRRAFRHGHFDLCPAPPYLFAFPGGDLDAAPSGESESLVYRSRAGLGSFLDSYAHGKVIRDGISVLLAGKPNVGKSSLLNALTLEQRAIVSHIPGTTRDVIEEIINIDGLPVRIIDSAGIRESHDEIEREGIRRSLEKLALADLVLFLVDGSSAIDRQDLDLLQAIAGKRFITVVNKTDLTPVLDEGLLPAGVPTVHISSKNGSGIDQLRSAIFHSFVSDRVLTSREHVAITSSRHRDILARALDGLDGFRLQLAGGASGELLSIDLRDSLAAIGEITGETTPDAILDILFPSLCIGK